MDHFRATMSRGFEMVKTEIIDFCTDIAQDFDTSHLREQQVSLPETWDDFQSSLRNGIQVTSYQRYLDWYHDSFRGTKRSSSNAESSTSTSDSSATRSTRARRSTRTRTRRQ